MNTEVTILVADDDEGHAGLIMRNLKRAGIINPVIRFKDGQEVLDFIFSKVPENCLLSGKAYILLLDIRMPKVDGTEVLAKIKQNDKLQTLPVIMLTTTDDPREVERCHNLGCNNYITKPVEYDNFVNTIRQLGMFLSVVEIPEMMRNKNGSIV